MDLNQIIDRIKDLVPKDIPLWAWGGMGLAAIVIGLIAYKIGKVVMQVFVGLLFLALAGGAVWYFLLRQHP